MPDGLDGLREWLEERVSTRTLPTALDPSTLATASFVDGTPAPVGPIVALMKSNKEADRAVFHAIRDRLDAGSMRKLTESLAEWWVRVGAPAKHRWAFEPLSEWGNESTMVLVGDWLRGWVKKKKRGPAQTAVEMLAQVGSESALHDLDELAHGKATPAFVEMARSAFAQAAKSQGISVEELADRVIPTLAFDAGGSRLFLVGNRTIRAMVRPMWLIELRDDQGRVVRSMPKGASDGSTSGTEWLKESKKRLKGTLAHQCGRLERAMISGRRWKTDRWKELFLQHPLMRTLGLSLVWLATNGAGEGILFRVAEDFTLADREDREIDISTDGLVSLPHPIHWNDGERLAWKQVFADYSIEQPFPQIEREVFELLPSEKTEAVLSRYVGMTVDGRFLRGLLKRQGWLMPIPWDGGAISFHFKFFDAHDVTAVLLHEAVSLGGNDSWAEPVPLAVVVFVRGEMDRHGDATLNDYPTAPLRHVPAVVLSETIRDIDRLIPRSAGTHRPSEGKSEDSNT
jgi:hypothetical protein